IIAPPNSEGGQGLKRLKARTAYVSGWMRVRGNRRRRGVDRGFEMSDHADWPALIRTVRQSQARQVYILHNPTDTLAHYLNEVMGLPAGPVPQGDAP
ncbi:MAG: DNA ligase-associated DEXH box helicase, partial [Myxococcales bacterium]|nr:DNA ligase-associated DEXH box helicase [Myxococcales bacterium]